MIEQQPGNRAVAEFDGRGQGAPAICPHIADDLAILTEQRCDLIQVAQRGSNRQIEGRPSCQQEPRRFEVALLRGPAVRPPYREVDRLKVHSPPSPACAPRDAVDRVDISAAIEQQCNRSARRSEHRTMQRRASRAIAAVYKSWLGIEKLPDTRDIVRLRSLMNWMIVARRNSSAATASLLKQARAALMPAVSG